MSYAHPEVLVDTEWVSRNPPGGSRRLVEVDYDPENGYRKGHIPGSSLIWWKRDVNDPVTRDIIDKGRFEELMSRNGIAPGTEVVLYGDFNNWFAAFVFWVFKYYGHEDIKIMNGGRIQAWIKLCRTSAGSALVIGVAAGGVSGGWAPPGLKRTAAQAVRMIKFSSNKNERGTLVIGCGSLIHMDV